MQRARDRATRNRHLDSSSDDASSDDGRHDGPISISRSPSPEPDEEDVPKEEEPDCCSVLLGNGGKDNGGKHKGGKCKGGKGNVGPYGNAGAGKGKNPDCGKGTCKTKGNPLNRPMPSGIIRRQAIPITSESDDDFVLHPEKYRIINSPPP